MKTIPKFSDVAEVEYIRQALAEGGIEKAAEEIAKYREQEVAHAVQELDRLKGFLRQMKSHLGTTDLVELKLLVTFARQSVKK